MLVTVGHWQSLISRFRRNLTRLLNRSYLVVNRMPVNQGKSKIGRLLKSSKQVVTLNDFRIMSEMIKPSLRSLIGRSDKPIKKDNASINYEPCWSTSSEIVPKMNNILKNCIFIRLCQRFWGKVKIKLLNYHIISTNFTFVTAQELKFVYSRSNEFNFAHFRMHNLWKKMTIVGFWRHSKVREVIKGSNLV